VHTAGYIQKLLRPYRIFMANNNLAVHSANRGAELRLLSPESRFYLGRPTLTVRADVLVEAI
jgi:hypothetical protein